MTRPDATCELWLDGVRVPYRPEDLQAGHATALDGLTVSWGREDAVEQPGVGTAAFVIRDPRSAAFRRPLLDTVHVGSKVEVWAVGSMPSPGASSIVEDPSFEGTTVGELPASRFDARLPEGTKRLLVDVRDLPTGRAVRVLAEGARVAKPVDLAPEPTTFQPFTRLVPRDRTLIPQGLAVEQATGDVFMSQIVTTADPEDMVIGRYVNGVSTGTPMSIPGGGHGDELKVTTIAGRPHLTFAYGSSSGANDSEVRRWVRLPWTPGKVWGKKEALTYTTTAPARDSRDRTPWWQGEAFYGGSYFRLYGGPYNNDGPMAVDMPARIEEIRAGKLVRVIDASMLGRGGMSASSTPINGRLEPEGMSLLSVDGVPCLVVNIAVGSKGDYQGQLYLYPLAQGAAPSPTPEPEPIEPSRVDVVFPPRPFVDPRDPPGDWDGIPQIQPGQTWPFTIRVRLPYGSTPGRVTAFAYTTPLASSRRSEPLLVEGGEVIADNDWHTIAGTVTLQETAGGPAWVALGLNAQLPSAAPWTASAGTWAQQPTVWDDYSTAYVDELQLYVPNTSERRSLVFSGEVSDVEAVAVAKSSVELRCTATDLFAVLGNDTIGAPAWSAEPVSNRAQKIAAAAHPPIPLTVDPTVGSVILSRRDVDSQPVLGLLQDVATSAGAALWAATHATTGPYVYLEDLDARKPLKTLLMLGGQIVVQSKNTGIVSACDVLRDDVSWIQKVDDVVTIVEVSWLAQILDDEGQPTTEERVETVTETAAVLARYGRRRLSVQTELTTSTAANALGAKLLQRSRNIGWRATGYTFDTRTLGAVVTSVPDSSRMRVLMDLLDGTSRIGLGLTLVDLPEYVPTEDVGSAYVEGGTYTYVDGHWSLALNISPAAGQGAGQPWAQIPADWSWNELAPDLAWADVYGATVTS